MRTIIYKVLHGSVLFVLQAHRTIEELFGRIKNIKEKAEHSEHMVFTRHTIHIKGGGGGQHIQLNH